jgi:hypothetical protein
VATFRSSRTTATIRTIFLTRIDASADELMLVDNFR